jgi:hypothetical protein
MPTRPFVDVIDTENQFSLHLYLFIRLQHLTHKHQLLCSYFSGLYHLNFFLPWICNCCKHTNYSKFKICNSLDKKASHKDKLKLKFFDKKKKKEPHYVGCLESFLKLKLFDQNLYFQSDHACLAVFKKFNKFN